jgi:hypothetical protein
MRNANAKPPDLNTGTRYLAVINNDEVMHAILSFQGRRSI